MFETFERSRIHTEKRPADGVPFLLASPYTLPTANTFGERSCSGGSLGVFQAEEIMGYLMGHALKLNRFGA